MLLPALMLLIAMLAQPACLLYTRCVMQASAAEGCRLLATMDEGTSGSAAARSYMLRRLAAVPDVAIFHEGGDAGWDIELSGDGSAGEASVRISTSVRPLPLMGVLPALLGKGDGAGGVRIEVAASRATRPLWLEGGYDEWASSWS